MHENGASIYGCGNADLPKPEWGRYTRRGDRLYAHILDRGIGPINLRGLQAKIAYARLLADDSEIRLDSSVEHRRVSRRCIRHLPRRLSCPMTGTRSSSSR